MALQSTIDPMWRQYCRQQLDVILASFRLCATWDDATIERGLDRILNPSQEDGEENRKASWATWVADQPLELGKRLRALAFEIAYKSLLRFGSKKSIRNISKSLRNRRNLQDDCIHLVQDVLAKVFRKFVEGDVRYLKSYLSKAIRHRIIDDHRKAKRSPAQMEADTIDPRWEDPSSGLEIVEAYQALQGVRNELPNRPRLLWDTVLRNHINFSPTDWRSVERALGMKQSNRTSTWNRVVEIAKAKPPSFTFRSVVDTLPIIKRVYDEENWPATDDGIAQVYYLRSDLCEWLKSYEFNTPSPEMAWQKAYELSMAQERARHEMVERMRSFSPRRRGRNTLKTKPFSAPCRHETFHIALGKLATCSVMLRMLEVTGRQRDELSDQIKLACETASELLREATIGFRGAGHDTLAVIAEYLSACTLEFLGRAEAYHLGYKVWDFLKSTPGPNYYELGVIRKTLDGMVDVLRARKEAPADFSQPPLLHPAATKFPLIEVTHPRDKLELHNLPGLQFTGILRQHLRYPLDLWAALDAGGQQSRLNQFYRLWKSGSAEEITYHRNLMILRDAVIHHHPLTQSFPGVSLAQMMLLLNDSTFDITAGSASEPIVQEPLIIQSPQ